MVRSEILEGVPLLPPLRFSSSSMSHVFFAVVLLERGQCGFTMRPVGAPEAIIFQTAPGKECRTSFVSQSETTPLLGYHQQPSRSPSSLPGAGPPPLNAVLTAPVIKAVLNYSLLFL
jgi:hypothetical protein